MVLLIVFSVIDHQVNTFGILDERQNLGRSPRIGRAIPSTKVFHSGLSESNAIEGQMLWCLSCETTESTRVGEIVIFDVFVALQVTEARNPLETVRKVLARQLPKTERIFGVESGEPDPRVFIVVLAALPERQPFRAHVFLIHLFTRPNTKSDVILRRKKGALFGQFVRAFIPRIANMGFNPVNAEIVASTIAVYSLDRFSTLQRHNLLGLKSKYGGEAVGVHRHRPSDGEFFKPFYCFLNSM